MMAKDIDKILLDQVKLVEQQLKNSFNKATSVESEIPKTMHPKFTSLQEMYDTAKPHKKKKGAAKTVGVPAVTQQYYTTNTQIYNLFTYPHKPSPFLEYLNGPPNSPGAPEQLDPPAKK